MKSKGFSNALHLIHQMNYMRSILLVSLIMLTAFSQAQPPAGVNRGGGAQNMNMGRFYGKVVDSDRKSVV